METIDEFRKNLKDLMNEKNLNITQLGKEIGLNPRTIRRWYEDRFPKVNSVVKISDYFGCSCDFLFGMTEIFEFQSSKKPVSFYSRYIELAEKKGFTDYRIAKICLIGRGTISKWKNGRVPDVYILLTLCKVFDCGFDYLLGRSDY